jgi:hypothetical protein
MTLGGYILHTRVKPGTFYRRLGLLVVLLVVLAAAALNWERLMETVSPWLVLVVAALVAATALIQLLRVLAAAHTLRMSGRVTLYEHGLAWERGGARKAWRWDEFTRVEGGTKPIRRGWRIIGYAWHFYIGTNEPLHLSPDYDRANDVNGLIADKIADALLKKTLFKVTRGGEVAFGPVLATRRALQIGERSIPWSMLRGAVVHGPYLAINFLNDQNLPRQLSVPHATIENMPVLLELIGKAIQRAMALEQ